MGRIGKRQAITRNRRTRPGERTMDRKLVDRILEDGKIDKVEMKILAGFVCDSSKLSKEDKLLLRDLFTKINSGEVKIDV